MTAFFFSNRKFVTTRSEQACEGKIDGDSRERCRKSVVLPSLFLKLDNEGFSGSIDDVGWDDVEDMARRYQGNQMC